MAARRLTRSNFFPSGFRAVISNMSSKRVTRAEVAILVVLFGSVKIDYGAGF